MFDRPRNGTVNRSPPYFVTNSFTGSQSSSSLTVSSTESRSDWLCWCHRFWNSVAILNSASASGPSSPVAPSPQVGRGREQRFDHTRQRGAEQLVEAADAAAVRRVVPLHLPRELRELERLAQQTEARQAGDEVFEHARAVCAWSTSRGLPPSDGGQYRSGSRRKLTVNDRAAARAR